jgi:hypothetical protein
VTKEPIQRQDDEQHECRLRQIGREADPDQLRVRRDVVRGGRGIVGDVRPGAYVTVGEATQDRDSQVVKASTPGETYLRSHDEFKLSVQRAVSSSGTLMWAVSGQQVR